MESVFLSFSQKEVDTSHFHWKEWSLFSCCPLRAAFHNYYLSVLKCSGTKPRKNHYIHTEYGAVLFFFPLKWPMSGFILLPGMAPRISSPYIITHTHTHSQKSPLCVCPLTFEGHDSRKYRKEGAALWFTDSVLIECAEPRKKKCF